MTITECHKLAAEAAKIICDKETAQGERAASDELWNTLIIRDVFDEPMVELEQLRAIVDRLPKTIDGVVVSEDMMLYIRDPETRHVEQWRCRWNALTLYRRQYKITDCYSTRKAAEAAGGEE